MDRPTENPASNSVTVLLLSNVLLVTMEMKSTSRSIVTDICRLSLMWEAPTQFYLICKTLLCCDQTSKSSSYNLSLYSGCPEFRFYDTMAQVLSGFPQPVQFSMMHNLSG
jgi:hypothetical protein